MTDQPHFVDANVPMYAAGAEHPLKHPCVLILTAIAQGDLAGVTSVEIVQEILHRYAALGDRTRAVEVARRFLRVIPLPFPVVPADLQRATTLLPQHPNLRACDVLHLAVMQNHGIAHIISADRHFDGIPGITRVDPLQWALQHR